MQTLTDDEVLTIVCEGEQIGRGRSREVYRHKTCRPDAVVKVHHGKRHNWNGEEAENVARLRKMELPHYLRIPDAYLHDEYLVMEYVGGEFAQYCDCEEDGCMYCDFADSSRSWEAIVKDETGIYDTAHFNVKLVDGVLWLIDLGDSII